MGSRIVWSPGPEKIIDGLDRYLEGINEGIFEIAQLIATEAEADMRRTAPWTDRTGHARQSLRGVAERAARDIAILYLIHGAGYGIYLELAHGQRYAVIMPTLQRILPRITDMLKALVGG